MIAGDLYKLLNIERKREVLLICKMKEKRKEFSYDLFEFLYPVGLSMQGR